jgi:LacI family trehalose operon transcriptional repressor
MQNRLTIKDIARLSGVGKSTVSRVLNNESGVSERTRERVEAVMQQHGFRPPAPRAMRGQSDKVVAIIVTRLDSLSENLAVQTMLPAFYEQGYDPIMMESQFSPALVEEHLGMLARRNIDGVVLFGFTGITKRCSHRGATRWCCWPATRRASPPSAMTTRGDHMLMQRLYDRGHRHISFLGVPHSDVTTGERRHQAYLAFCKKHRLAHRRPAGPGHEAGYETVASVLTAETSALVCATDTLALGASKYLQQQGIDICSSPASAARR